MNTAIFSYRGLLLTVWALLAHATAAEEPPPVDLIPENRMGARGYTQIKELVWKCHSPWFGKTATVHRVRAVMPDGVREKLLALAKAKGWTLRLVSPKPGRTWYEGEDKDEGLILYDNTGMVIYSLTDSDDYERDENEHPIVEPLPDVPSAVADCLEWMEKIGLEREGFAKDPEAPGGLMMWTREGAVNCWNKIEQKATLRFPFKLCVNFNQRIGDFPAFWSGYGGRCKLTITHRGEMAIIRFCLRQPEPMGEYEVLDRKELEKAILEGFCWVYEPIKMERAVVTDVELRAFHNRGDDAQRHFPLLWCLDVEPEGKPGEKVGVLIPALRQHRDKYGGGRDERREARDE